MRKQGEPKTKGGHNEKQRETRRTTYGPQNTLRNKAKLFGIQEKHRETLRKQRGDKEETKRTTKKQ